MALRIDCFWGQSGTGKSEGAAEVIEAVYESDGLTSRVIIGDGSKATYIDRGLVDAGVVEICDFSMRPFPSSTFSKLCEGWWPADVEDPRSPLIKPTAEDLKKYGVFVVEGLSVGAQYLMGDNVGGLAEQASRGIKIGQDSPIRLEDVVRNDKGLIVDGLRDEKGKIITEGISFGGNPVAHYGYVQRRLLANLERTKVFPNMVIWTAHEKGTQDKISGEKIVGPEAAGEALTANLPRHFNNTLHFVTASRKKEKKKHDHTDEMVTELDTEYRVYTRDHFHPDGNVYVKYKAVTRGVNKEQMPEYLTDEQPGKSVRRFYAKLAELRQERAAKLAAGKKAA